MMISLAMFASIYLILGYLATRIVLYIAKRKNILDRPNERSSHTTPTPRIGGLGFVSIISIILAIELVIYAPPQELILALLLPTILLSMIGLVDDLFSLSSKIRFCFQAILALTVVILVAPFSVEKAWSTIAISITLTIAVVWLINLFNFMDGIDGIAGVEAIFILLSLALLLVLHNSADSWSKLMFFSAMPVVGFLFLNWSPARIFMGDVGSTYLGLFIGCFMLIAIKLGLSVWSCVILVGVFLCDATWTLVTRYMTGQKWYAPHRSHTYQKLAVRYSSHRKVSTLVIIVNISWLFPLSTMASLHPETGSLLATVAFIPLFLAGHIMKAGHEER